MERPEIMDACLHIKNENRDTHSTHVGVGLTVGLLAATTAVS